MSDNLEYARYTEGGMQQYEDLLKLQKKQLELIEEINSRQTDRIFELLERGVQLKNLSEKGSYLSRVLDSIKKYPGDASAEAGATVAANRVMRQDSDPLRFASEDPSVTLET